MLVIDPKSNETALFQKYLLGSVAPRPIAFVSSIDAEGNANLSPFSFFNAFSASPPILVFSPAKRIRNNTPKHTLENARETKEVVISMVNYDLVNQVSLSSADFPKGVSEFEKAGVTPIPAKKVSPFLVKESPVNFECKVLDIISLGDEGGSGNLVICEVLLMHIHSEVLDDDNMIDPLKIDLVSRMGGIWYGRTTQHGLFEVKRPAHKTVIGIDSLPDEIKNSEIFSGNDLALLANVQHIPAYNKEELLKDLTLIRSLVEQTGSHEKQISIIHTKAKESIAKGNVEEAWKVLLAFE